MDGKLERYSALQIFLLIRNYGILNRMEHTGLMICSVIYALLLVSSVLPCVIEVVLCIYDSNCSHDILFALTDDL